VNWSESSFRLNDRELTEDFLSDTITIAGLHGLGYFLAIATVIRPPENCRQTNTCFMSPVS
jgi:hypothetical protein